MKLSKKETRAVQGAHYIMKPEEASAMAAKNSRTILKLVQLLELKKKVGADAIDKNNGSHIGARIERLQTRLNRRLKKLAKWSDEKLDDRLPVSEKQYRAESAYKQNNRTSVIISVPAGPTSAAANSRSKDTPAYTQLNLGSGHNYTEQYNSQIKDAVELSGQVELEPDDKAAENKASSNESEKPSGGVAKDIENN